jgi:hypothetical protein
VIIQGRDLRALFISLTTIQLSHNKQAMEYTDMDFEKLIDLARLKISQEIKFKLRQNLDILISKTAYIDTPDTHGQSNEKD